MKFSLIIFFLTFLIVDQGEITLQPEQSTLQVLGTSSVHDWESSVTNFSVKGYLSGDEIKDLDVEVTTESIESGKSIMDDKTYEALESGRHPKIKFSAEQLFIKGKQVNGEGKLTLAGTSKKIPVTASLIERESGRIKVEGEVKLKMSDYGVTPPTAMFGTLKTGDEVTIKYNLLLAE